MCSVQRGTNCLEQAVPTCHETSSLVVATRDSRRGSASTRSTHRRQKRGKREHPTRQAGTASRRSTVCPADPSATATRSQVHHSAKTTGAISAQSTAPISKAHLPLSTRECELSHRARLMARKGSAKLFWQPTQKAGEGGGDHTGDAEPGTGPGLGRSSPGDLAPRAVEPDGAAAPRGRCGKYRL